MNDHAFKDGQSQTISQLNLLDAQNMTESSLIPIEKPDGTYATTLEELIHKYAYEFQEKQLCGAILAFGHTSVSEKWLLCDGAEVSQTQYSDLYAKIGHSWGTASQDGFFMLPCLTDQGRFLRSYIPDSKDKDGNPITGTPIGRLQDDTMQNITGTLSVARQGDNTNPDPTGVFKQTATWNAHIGTAKNDDDWGGTYTFNSNTVTRHDEADETRPANASVAYYIHI